MQKEIDVKIYLSEISKYKYES